MNNIGFTWTRSGIEMRNWFRFCRFWCTIRRYFKSGKSGLGRSGGHSSLVHLACSTPRVLFVLRVLSAVFCFPVLLFDLDSKKTKWRGPFGHWHRPIGCQANICAMSLWQLEQSQRPLLIRVFQPHDLGHEYLFSGGKEFVSWFRIEVPSLTAFAMDIPTTCNWAFNPSSSSIRVFSSAVHYLVSNSIAQGSF